MDQPKKAKKKSKLEIKKDLQDQYDAWRVMAVAGYVNSPEEKLAKDIIEEVALYYNFIPSYFATIVLTEGLGILYLDISSNYSTTAPYGIRNDIQVEGYQLGGVDDFGFHFEDRYKKLLPNHWNEGASANDLQNGAEFMKVYQTNEKGESIVTANFNNMESIIWACGATLANRRSLFKRDLRSLGYGKPSEDEMAYWNYMYYQGEGRAFRALKAAGSFDIMFINRGYSPNRVITQDNREPNDVALSNLASWRYLQTFNIFSK